MDYADACHIGRSGNRYFLLFVDKTTEYVQNYNTKTRSNPTPLTLLKSFITFTGKVPRYLRMDGAKEFHSAEMLDFCRDNNIVIQPVIAYNHTAMCRVESYIGVVKSHSRISMLNSHVPMGMWSKILLSNVTLPGIPRKDCPLIQRPTNACILHSRAHSNLCAYLLAPALFLLSSVNTLLSRVLLSAIVMLREYICLLIPLAPPSISGICTGNKKCLSRITHHTQRNSRLKTLPVWCARTD